MDSWTFRRCTQYPAHGGQGRGCSQDAVEHSETLIDRVKTSTLTAQIGGTKLSPESFTQPGSFTFVRDVPAKLLQEDSVRVDFALDRFLPAGSVDGRELGLVVTSVGFVPQKSATPIP